ncbi:hypothetical protein [Candidatus Electronema sp. TJ]|uniref:hypothetical protein n=1 Tax=Candidatus Electronema sp. TJ TaxID=3401573 RepID=UPI003AA92433
MLHLFQFHPPNSTTHLQKIKPKPAALTPKLPGMTENALANCSNQLLMAFHARQLRLNEEQIRLDLPHIKLDPPLLVTSSAARGTLFTPDKARCAADKA